MKAIVEIDSSPYAVDFSEKHDISIPLIFNGEQPNTYGVEIASSKAYQDDQFIGDTRKGGPCNFETYTLTPHCNGTHTECIGHITEDRVTILESLNKEIIPSTLISITPKKNKESYIPEINNDDLLITKEDLALKLKDINQNFLDAVIIRTLPNNDSKKSQDYLKKSSCFFSLEAMRYLVKLGVNHLLVDTPSVDRLLDDGHLSTHNIFWETQNKEFNPSAKHKTITEMIFVDNQIEDGNYLLNLQIPAFVSDAAPSRPILYMIDEL